MVEYITLLRILFLFYGLYLVTLYIMEKDPPVNLWIPFSIIAFYGIRMGIPNLLFPALLHIVIFGVPALLGVMDKKDFFYILPMSLSSGWPFVLSFLGAGALSFLLLGLFAGFTRRDGWFVKTRGKRRYVPITWAFSVAFSTVQIGLIYIDLQRF